MAANPEFIKAFSKILWVVLPFFVLGQFINLLPVRKRKRPRRTKRARLMSVLLPLAAVAFLLVLLFQKDRGDFWTLVLPLSFITGGLLAINYWLRHQNEERFFEGENTLQKLRALHPSQFEEYIVILFKRLGYRTERVGGAYDGGVDIIAEKNGEKRYIQCKKFITRQVSVHDVRDFFGALTDKGPDTHGLFITTNIFTTEAERFCEGKLIELVDGRKLMEYVKRVGKTTIPESMAELCPRDGGTLVQRNGKFGPFIGCSNFPRCTYTQNISPSSR